MSHIFGANRRVVLAREITKMFETIHSTVLADLPNWLSEDSNQQKGEFVLVVEGAEISLDESSLEMQNVLSILLEELPVKQASQLTAKLTGMKKNAVYKHALTMLDK